MVGLVKLHADVCEFDHVDFLTALKRAADTLKVNKSDAVPPCPSSAVRVISNVPPELACTFNMFVL